MIQVARITAVGNELPLTLQDLVKFRQSFIDENTIELADIYRVDSDEGARLIGRQATFTSDYSGVVFPYFLPEQTEAREYRLRRDTPDLELRNGETKEKRKYLSPPGKSNMIYFPPQCDRTWLEDSSIPVVIAEGEKKTLALNRVAWHGLGDAAEKPRFLSLGLSGVWGFRGTIGKAINARGQRQPFKGVITDFSLLTLEHRTVTILYDANVSTNESVRAARDSLARTMKDAGAKVLIADCPVISGCNGIDDVLGMWERSEELDGAIKRCLDLLTNATKFKEEKVSQANKLLQIADGIEVFHTPENEPFATIEVDGHVEHHRVNSQAFRQRLAFEFYNENGKAPSTQAVQDAVQAISGKAIYEGREGNVNIRVAAFEGNIFIDLCNASWQIIEIGKNGWKIVEAAIAPVKFRRTKAMTSLPTPSIVGDLQKLVGFLNVTPRNLILILGWLINCFRPDYPFPILLLSGEQGTAKSTSSRVLRDLIDPCITSFRSAPKNEQDLIISASNSWIVGLDNLSNIPDWLSDALCRLSTGGGFAARKLFTDDDETILNAKRPIIINGIGDLASRSDLLDRALIVRLDPIPKEKRKTESSFWREFERERPAILSALLSAVSCGLKNLDTVTIDGLPRMADFAHWVTACERGLGLDENAFLDVYDENRRDAHSVVLEDSMLAEVIQEFCETTAINDECDVCDVLLKHFLEQLKGVAGDKRSNDKRFPKSSRGLRSGLERINPNLREIGIHVTFHGKSGPNANKGASLSLKYRGKQTSQPSLRIKNELKTADLSSQSIQGSRREYVERFGGVTDGPQGHNLTIITIPQVHQHGISPENDGSDVCEVAPTSFSVSDSESKVEDLRTEKRY